METLRARQTEQHIRKNVVLTTRRKLSNFVSNKYEAGVWGFSGGIAFTRMIDGDFAPAAVVVLSAAMIKLGEAQLNYIRSKNRKI